MARTSLPSAVFCVLSLLSAAVAQPVPVPVDTRAEALLEAKELAKAKRALAAAQPAELAREQATAAQTVYEAWAAEFAKGRGSIYSLLDAAAHWRDARLARGPAAERFAVEEAEWAALWHIAAGMQQVYDAGRVGIREYSVAQYDRLAADHRLARSAGQRQTQASPVQLPSVLRPFAADQEAGGLLHTKALAQAKRAALRADPDELLTARWQTAQTATHAQWREFVAGRGSYYFLIRWAQRLRDTGTSRATAEVDRFAQLDRYWVILWLEEGVQGLRYERGRVPPVGYLTPRYHRLEAERFLAQAWAALPTKETRTPLPSAYGGYPFYFLDLDGLAADESPNTKEVARGKRAALGADPLAQARAKLRTAGEEYQSQVQPFQEGRGYVGFLYDAAYHMLESELALAPGEAERVAARQHHWERLARAAAVVKMRYELGRVPVQDYAESIRRLRGAELMLRQAPDGPANK